MENHGKETCVTKGQPVQCTAKIYQALGTWLEMWGRGGHAVGVGLGLEAKTGALQLGRNRQVRKKRTSLIDSCQSFIKIVKTNLGYRFVSLHLPKTHSSGAGDTTLSRY